MALKTSSKTSPLSGIGFSHLFTLLLKKGSYFYKTDNTDYFSFIQTQSFQGYSVVFQTENLYEEETIPANLLIKLILKNFF